MCKLSIGSQFSEIRIASAALREYCELHDIPEDKQAELELMLVEALNNVVEHAYKQQPGNPIDLALDLVDRQAVMRIIDRGLPAPGAEIYSSNDLPDIEEFPEGGWGLYLIQVLADVIEYYRHPEHNELVLKKGVGAAV